MIYWRPTRVLPSSKKVTLMKKSYSQKHLLEQEAEAQRLVDASKSHMQTQLSNIRSSPQQDADHPLLPLQARADAAGRALRENNAVLEDPFADIPHLEQEDCDADDILDKRRLTSTAIQ